MKKVLAVGLIILFSMVSLCPAENKVDLSNLLNDAEDFCRQYSGSPEYFDSCLEAIENGKRDLIKLLKQYDKISVEHEIILRCINEYYPCLSVAASKAKDKIKTHHIHQLKKKLLQNRLEDTNELEKLLK